MIASDLYPPHFPWD
uniref:Uncharacterized protein n=1 Tax=Arundo donax TaxID=35708 RepID=A0A0A8ZZP2_ARUDO